jgi:hypothetical protein
MSVMMNAALDDGYRQGCWYLGPGSFTTVRSVDSAHTVDGRVAVTFPAPHGTESLVLHDGDVAHFGRGGDCGVRFGYAPIADVGVPRVAGRFVVAAERVFVESVDVTGRRSLEIIAAGRPPVLLGIGDGFAPSENEFRVTVHGEQRAWVLSVVVRREVSDANRSGWEPPTRSFELRLTETQQRVVAAYVEPLRNGRMEPATHREVATALSYHPNSAREALYEVWARMFAAGIPMPDVSDKRVAVVEAVRLHRLLARDGDDV